MSLERVRERIPAEVAERLVTEFEGGRLSPAGALYALRHEGVDIAGLTRLQVSEYLRFEAHKRRRAANA